MFCNIATKFERAERFQYQPLCVHLPKTLISGIEQEIIHESQVIAFLKDATVKLMK